MGTRLSLFGICTSRKLFDTIDDGADKYLCQLSLTLRKLPEPWWSSGWIRRGDFFHDDAEKNRSVVEIDPCEDEQGGISRSLQETLSVSLVFEDDHSPDYTSIPIPEDEIVSLADLLSKILKYDPTERISIHQALQHGWFKFIKGFLHLRT